MFKKIFILILILLTLNSVPNYLFSKGNENSKYYKKEAREFDKIARKILAPVYPVIANQIVKDFGITKGICVDIGCGPGHLMLEMAKITDLIFYGIDINPEMLKFANMNFNKANKKQRLVTIENDAHNLCLKDNFADIVISRGSLPFFHNKAQVFREIYRILKKDGVAFIGGGLGRDLDQEIINSINEKLNPIWKKKGWVKKVRIDPEEVKRILWEIGITDFKFHIDPGCPCSLWIEFHKKK